MICYPVSGGVTFEWKGKHSLKNKYGYEDPHDVYTVCGWLLVPITNVKIEEKLKAYW